MFASKLLKQTFKTTIHVSNPFTLYSVVGTPNGLKPVIALALLKQKYKLYPINFSTNEQKEEWFLKINPNGRIPALVDHTKNDFAVFESGAILLYLADHYDPNGILSPKDPLSKSKVVQWVMWQMGGLGPMMGQASWFKRNDEKIPTAIGRYVNESKRLLSVLESKLSKTDYLVGDQITIADISSFSWARMAPKLDISLDEFPATKKWIERLEANLDVQKGLKSHDI